MKENALGKPCEKHSDSLKFVGNKVKLENRIECIRGVAYKAAIDLHDELNRDSCILLRANNIQDGEIVFDDVQYVDKSKVKVKQMLRRGDILVCSSSGSKGLVGKAALVKNDMEATFGAFCCVLRPKCGESKLLGYYFQSHQYRNAIENACSGSNINNLKAANFNALIVPRYCEADMHEIEDIFEAVAAQLRKANSQIAQLDSLIKSRFIEMFGEEQRLVELSDVCETFNGDRSSNYPSADERINAGIPFVNAGNLANGAIAFNNMEYVSEEKYHQLSGGRIQTGDLLYCLRGSLGKCALADFDKGTVASSLMIIRCNQERILPKYLYETMVSPFVERQMASANNGSSQPNLSAKSVKQFKIPLPPLALQQEFAAFVAQVDKLRFAAQQQIDKLETLKKSLMQEYFN